MFRLGRILIILISTLVIAACNRTGNKGHTGELTLSNGEVFESTLVIPESWSGKFEARTEGNILWFDYSVNQEMKMPIFSVAGLTDEEWTAIQQEPGHGQLLLTRPGAVFIYNIALENLYSGSQADEFQRMAGDVQEIVNTLSVTAVD